MERCTSGLKFSEKSLEGEVGDATSFVWGR